MSVLAELLSRLWDGSPGRGAARPQPRFETLEPRLLLSADPFPIDPSSGEANLLEIIDAIPLNDINTALDHFPIPFVVIASADGSAIQVDNGNAGAPVQIDADGSKLTGKGKSGHDLEIEVNTVLLPTPHLTLEINRLGTANFAEDLMVIVAFPFDAFTNELLPGAANLFFGYQSTAADGSAGGIAPLSEVITFTPGTLAGAEHLFDVTLQTTGDVNPLQFFAGHFDGDVNTGVLNFDGLAAWVETVPDLINIGLDVAENGLFTPAMFTSFGLEWTATSPSKVVFSYIENEAAPGGNPSDYATTLTFDQMPTQESFSLVMDEDLTTLTLSHRANAVIGEIVLQKVREDGLVIRGIASDVPTEVDLTYDFDPSVTLDVNDDTLDLTLEVSRAGGIPGTTGFFAYPIGYASVRVMDAPDLVATWDADFDSFSIETPNPGEFVGAVEVLLDDNGHYGAIIDGQVDADGDGDVDGDDDEIVAGFTLIDGRIDVNADGVVDGLDDGTVAGMAVINGRFDVDASGLVDGGDDFAEFLVGLYTPPSYFEGLPGGTGDLHHLFSLVDDGLQGTVVARIVRVDEVLLDLDPDSTETFHMVLAAPGAPMQAYLRTWPTSTLVPGHDIEMTCDIDVVPYGVFDIHFDGPGNFGYTTTPPQGIDSIHCFGHMDTLNFDVDAGGLPPVFDFEFDPDSHITIFAGDGFGGPAEVGHVAARFWDSEGPGLPDTEGLLGQILRDARMRVDDIPSSHAEWTQVQLLAYDGGAGALPAPGAYLYSPSTDATARVIDASGAAPASGTIRIGFVETGTFDDNATFEVLDLLEVDGQTEDVAVGAMLLGASSGASAIVRRADQIGGSGRLYLSDISGTFLNNEDLTVDAEVVAQADGAVQAGASWTANVNGALAIDGTVMDFGTDDADVFLGGVQFLVSTAVELEDPLPVADPSAPHFALLEEEFVDSVLVQRLGGGAFGIDEFHLDTFSSLNLHYDANEAHLLLVDILRQFDGAFFPDDANFEYDLHLAVDAVPQQFDFSSDLETQFVYEASDPINSVTLAGTVDETDDSAENGFEIAFGMLGLPSEVRFGLVAEELAIVNGLLDVNGDSAVNADDDGLVAGWEFSNGRIDVNSDGTINGADDGRFFGIAVIDGELNVDGNGGVDGDDDGGLAGASLRMNGGISEVGFLLRSQDNAVGIHDSPYRIIQALADDVPAELTLSYGAERFLLETRDQFGNPDGLELIQALVSTTKIETENDAKALPFTLDGPVQGGPILGDVAITGGDPGGSRINYSQFLQEIDKRYYNGGVPDPSGVLTRLAELYADSEQLDLSEDHLLVRMEDPDSGGSDDTVGFASFQFNDFQRLSWTPDANGGEFIFRAPGRGDESFFAGYETDDEFMTLQVEHIPDEVIVDFDDTEHLTYTASASPGEIDFYKGPAIAEGLFAGDNANATRAIMRNTPDSVRVFWDFGFPQGGAFMDASNEFEILFLTQDGGNRITAGLTLEDLHLEYGIELLSFDVTKSIEIWNPFGDNFVIPIAWELFEAKAGIDNDADGLTLGDLTDNDLSDIGGTGNPDVAGFFALYDDVSSPSPIVGAPPESAPGSEEFVPVITVMEEGFNEFSVDFVVELDPTNPGADLYPIDLELTVVLTGNLVLDIWSSANTDFTDDGDIPFIPEVGFVNPPDYTNNTPFHILPGIVPGNIGATIANGLAGIHVVHDWVITWDGFHTFDEHFDPYAGTPDPFGGSSGDGGFDGGDAEFVITTLGPFSGALSRWQGALAASGVYTDEQAADLINDVANNTTIVVGSFAGAKIGEASGDSSGATITIDPDAGGFEWFVDTSPFADTEYDGGGPAPADLTASGGDAFNKVDMLSFFAHEIGHILGFGHATTGVMQDTLPRSERHLPVADDVDPGAPPTSAPPSDDVAALMVEVAEGGALESDTAGLVRSLVESSSAIVEVTDTPAFVFSIGTPNGTARSDELESGVSYLYEEVGVIADPRQPISDNAQRHLALRMQEHDALWRPAGPEGTLPVFDFGTGSGAAYSGIDWQAGALYGGWTTGLSPFDASKASKGAVSNFPDYLVKMSRPYADGTPSGYGQASYDSLGSALLKGGKQARAVNATV